MRILTRQDMSDLLIGAGILGCGGGGSAQLGQRLINAIYDLGKQFTLIDPMEIPDEAYLCIIAGVGGGVGKENKEKLKSYLAATEKQDLVELQTRAGQKAIRELEDLIGKHFYTYVPSELGPGNTILPMYLAALEGKPAIDADACGRAKPEMSLSTTHVAGIPISPMAMTNTIGDVMILKKAADDYRGEDIARYMAVISGGMVSVVRAPSTAANYKQGVVRNSISRCIRLGSIERTSKEKKINPVESILKSEPDCLRLFKGKAKSWTRKEEGGFMWGDISIQGSGGFRGKRLDIWYKNEYLVTRLNRKPYATCPDSISLVNASTGEGLSAWVPNLKTQIGREIDVLGFKADRLWRTEKGVKLFGPKHFGYDVDYTPIEKLVG
jgi:DUF917 family protein